MWDSRHGGWRGCFQNLTLMAPSPSSPSSGLFGSLQQAQSVSSQDLLIAVDACEELLQEVDITPFLLALCGHTRGLPQAPPSPGPLSPGPFSSSIEEGPEPRERAVLASESRLGWSRRDASGLHQIPVNRLSEPGVRLHEVMPTHRGGSCFVPGFLLPYFRLLSVSPVLARSVQLVEGWRVAGCHQ